LLQLLLVVLISAALPVQGAAAVARIHCASMAAMHAGDSASTDSMQASMHDAHAPMAHDGHGAHATATAHTAPHEASTPSHQGQSGEHKCSACAACHLGAALPVTMTSFAPPRLPSMAPWLPDVATKSFVPAGLERPPKPTFA
jgi:hypothetical protein